MTLELKTGNAEITASSEAFLSLTHYVCPQISPLATALAIHNNNLFCGPVWAPLLFLGSLFCSANTVVFSSG